GYDLALLSLKGLEHLSEADLARHAAAVAEVMPIVGFYLQTAVGGRRLSHAFWRDLAELPGLVAIKVAPFDRYATLDVVRAVAASSRADDVALYTGNDDSILVDLLTPFRVVVDGRVVEKRIVGGLLGQWAVWTRAAVALLEEVKRLRGQAQVPAELLTRAARLTDANAAVFDAANRFHGVIAGVHEVLRRQGLLAGAWCLDPDEGLSPGQAEEIARVAHEHRDLPDDEVVRAHRAERLRCPSPRARASAPSRPRTWRPRRGCRRAWAGTRTRPTGRASWRCTRREPSPRGAAASSSARPRSCA